MGGWCDCSGVSASTYNVLWGGKSYSCSIRENCARYMSRRDNTAVIDVWHGCSGLRALGYNQQTVNHSQNFVDPVTGNLLIGVSLIK